MIVSFSGVKFSGKDTAAEGLIRSHKFKRLGLADKLKDICSTVFNIPRVHMDDPTMKEAPFTIPVSVSPIHIHELLSIISRDGYDFEFHSTYELLCKNFMGRNLTSIREVLQVVGTDVCRNYIKDDIWLQYCKTIITTHDGDLVITDARFQNERDFLAQLGAVMILVVRPGFDNKSAHISENQLGTAEDYDVVVTNEGTVTALQSDIAMWYTVMKDALISKTSKRV
jgi:hypothetical protein